MNPPSGSGPPGNGSRDRRKLHRQHLSQLFADIPPKRRAAFSRRAAEVLAKILEESDPEDSRFDDKDRLVRLGTSKRDRAAIVKDALSSFKLLGEISRDATEQHIAVTRLIHGILSPQGKPGAPSEETVPLEDLTSLKQTVEHNLCPPTLPTAGPPAETAQSSSEIASPTSESSAD